MSPPSASRRRRTRMASTADLVGIVSQHIFGTLYTFDKGLGHHAACRRVFSDLGQLVPPSAARRRVSVP